jgi:hypothetical protein
MPLSLEVNRAVGRCHHPDENGVGVEPQVGPGLNVITQANGSTARRGSVLDIASLGVRQGITQLVGLIGGGRRQVGAPEPEITAFVRLKGVSKGFPTFTFILHIADEHGFLDFSRFVGGVGVFRIPRLYFAGHLAVDEIHVVEHRLVQGLMNVKLRQGGVVEGVGAVVGSIWPAFHNLSR